jgi:segregation and condensation protein B
LRELKRDVEALLFAAGRPLNADEIAAAVDPDSAAGREEVLEVLAALAREFPVDGSRGFELAEVAEGWAFRTNRASEEALAALFDLGESDRLSQAAIETLAIVAYLQPVTRREVAEIRGVNSDSTVQTLLERDLIIEAGRSDQPGSPILYGTTKRFLITYGLNGLQGLPDLEGMQPSPETREELRRKLFVATAPE